MAFCANCGTKHEGGKFCSRCGNAINVNNAPIVNQTPPPQITPSNYQTPPSARMEPRPPAPTRNSSKTLALCLGGLLVIAVAVLAFTRLDFARSYFTKVNDISGKYNFTLIPPEKYLLPRRTEMILLEQVKDDEFRFTAEKSGNSMTMSYNRATRELVGVNSKNGAESTLRIIFSDAGGKGTITVKNNKQTDKVNVILERNGDL